MLIVNSLESKYLETKRFIGRRKGAGAKIAKRNFEIIQLIKCSRYRPGVAQRVGRGIALLFHDRGTRRE